jgi:tRNA (guanine-N7-)-methyltransferase
LKVRKPKRLPLEALAPYLLELPDPPRPFDWSALFGNDRTVELEVGFGKGGFLVAVGEANPETNYVGVEIDRALQLYVATRIAKRELRNVRVARADARLFMQGFVGSGSLRAIHVYFPDPWWKKRHKKRRVFTKSFAAECARTLQPGGLLFLATDVEEYFGVMTELMGATQSFERLPENEPLQRSETNFERKAREQGQAVWRARFRRTAT